MDRFSPFALAAVVSLALLAPRAGWATDPEKDPDEIGNRDVGKGLNLYSLEREIALGKHYAQEVERESKIVDDPVIAEYVNRVGQNLVRNSDAKVPFTIKVIDGEQVNAFALPGGFFFVYTGLIMAADSEAQLAGVMAHEIAHVAARHATRQMTRGQIINWAMIPLIFVGGWAGYGAYEGASVAIPITFLKFSRAQESEADMLGLEYMYKAGYDPTAFVDFFEKIQTMEKRKPGTVSKIFSDHPPTDDRVKAAQKNIQELLKAKPEYVVNTSEFDNVKTRLMAMENRHKVTDKDANKPQLRKKPGSGTSTGDSGSTTDQKGSDDSDDRPTLKRRD